MTTPVWIWTKHKGDIIWNRIKFACWNVVQFVFLLSASIIARNFKPPRHSRKSCSAYRSSASRIRSPPLNMSCKFSPNSRIFSNFHFKKDLISLFILTCSSISDIQNWIDESDIKINSLILIKNVPNPIRHYLLIFSKSTPIYLKITQFNNFSQKHLTTNCRYWWQFSRCDLKSFERCHQQLKIVNN